jgi:hypothetical protein
VVDAAGRIRYVGEGTYNLTISSAETADTPAQSLILALSAATATGTMQATSYEAKAGSLRASVITGMDTLLAAATAADKPLLDSPTARNADCWLAADNLPCIPTAGAKNGVLVTARHLICAKHYPYSVSDTVSFLAADDTAATATVAAVATHATADIAVIRFADALPAAITPAQVMPADWLDYLPVNDGGLCGYGVPIICIDQDRRAIPFDGVDLTATTAATSASSVRNPYAEELVEGDSGGAWLMLVGSDLVALSASTAGGYSPRGSCLPNVLAWVRGRIAGWGDEDTLTEADLTSFTNYG